MDFNSTIAPAFADNAAPDLFDAAMKTAGATPEERAELKSIMKNLGLPLPQKEDQMLRGTDGCLLFLDHAGIVVRLEKKENPIARTVRLNDNEDILQPLFRREAGQMVVELCPGGFFEKDDGAFKGIERRLNEGGYEFFDSSNAARNMVRLPIPTKRQPDGIRVIADRGAVRKLDEKTIVARKIKLKKKNPDAVDLQAEFYRPLVEAAYAAWPAGAAAPDADKMKIFWDKVSGFHAEGKLVAGWNDHETYPNGDKPDKAIAASQSAKNYAALLATKAAPAAAPALQLN